MPPPFFQQKQWQPFTTGGVTYTFDHLAEFAFNIVDSAGNNRKIAVSYSDHVFTRDGTAGEDASNMFPGCSREYGIICPERYSLSLELKSHIEHASKGDVWIVDGDTRYAHMPIITCEGKQHLAAIVFSLERVRGLPLDIHMRVRSAHLCDWKVPATFGSVKFKHLVRRTVEGKPPPKRYDRDRKQPKKPR